MRTKLTILAGALIFGASMGQAATSYILDFNTQSNSPGLVYDGSYAISPYSGTVNGTSVNLYCDDFNDTINFGQQNISVYSTALNADSSTLSAQTRYGAANPSSTYTDSGSTLYEEMAWLATQMQYTGSTNDKAIQEAIWQLTDAPGGSSAPNNSRYNNGSASSGDDGTAQSAAKWIQDAQSYIDGFNATTGTSSWGYANHYANLDVSDWYIITSVNSAGCTVGNDGPKGCSGSTTQEFLAYSTGGLSTSTGNQNPPPPPGVPEPATFGLIGSGLVAGALVRRRKACKA
ncbi:MAG TPA: PEP-CTERM sorting domain-containing protein [Bryobacteraceae bacterium]|nr:PEP-CTERM sorting domain-containing protein [Bryobacteraceae bacterium]